MRDPRLGDDIDDYCVRCKRVMNHAVVSVINNLPAKVRCRTCHSDHDFRNEQAPPPKVDLRKQALFKEVLKKVNPDEAGAVEAAAEIDLDVAAPEILEEPVEIAVEAPDPEPEPVPVPKPKAKAKAKGRK